MPESADLFDQPHPRRRIWPWIVLLLLFSLVASLAVCDRRGQAQLDAAVRDARAIDPLLTMEEIEAARRKWTDEENGALLLLPVFPKLEAVLKEEAVQSSTPLVGKLTLPEPGRRWPDETDQAVAQLLERLGPEMAVVDRIRQFKGGRFPLDHAELPHKTLLPHLAPLRAAARLKYLQMLHAAMHGDHSDLVQDVEVMLHLADFLEDEPSLISGLVRMAIQSLTLTAVLDVAGLRSLNGDEIREMDALLASIEGEKRLYWGMLGERAIFWGACEYVRKNPSTEGDLLPYTYPNWPGFRGLARRDQATGLQLIGQYVQMVKNPDLPSEGFGGVIAQKEALPRSYVLTKMLVPSFDRVMLMDHGLDAEVRSARVILQAEWYRQQTGHWPESIEPLIPRYIESLPMDPFSPQVLLEYHVGEAGVIVYSIGENGQDDGGDVYRRRLVASQNRPSDAGFFLPNPDRRGLLPTLPASAPQDEPDGWMNGW